MRVRVVIDIETSEVYDDPDVPAGDVEEYLREEYLSPATAIADLIDSARSAVARFTIVTVDGSKDHFVWTAEPR